jgi:enoyl-CoA hydratase/carnithine racemase
MGLVQEVVPDGQALERALALAAMMADYPWASLVNDRRAAYEGLALGLAEGIAREMDLHAADLMDKEMHDGLERFISGRRPQPPQSLA